MSEKESILRKITEHKLLIFLPAALAVIAILLGYFCAFFPLITGTISFGFDYLEWNVGNLFKNLFGDTCAYLFTLLLPAGVILAKKLNKPIIAKILFFVALVFLAGQLFSAFICLILSFFNVYSSGFWSGVQDFFSSFCGAEVLSGLVYMVKDLFSGFKFIMVVGLAISDAVASFASLLFILANALCAVICLPMIKKQ